jgi:predicted Kef-type K+ transport protein
MDPHQDSYFLPVSKVNIMKHIVKQAQPQHEHATQSHLSGRMLDNCKKTFIATQGHIAKTNNTIFANMALMALVCHHDCPLVLANMTSAGKQQYYTLALIKALLQQLLTEWNVGLLYDIACQLEHSMQKVHSFTCHVLVQAELGLA